MIDAQNGINHGYFVTEEDIEKRRPLRVTHLLQDFRELSVTRRGDSPYDFDVRGPTIDNLSGQRCLMTIYLDGQRVLGAASGAFGTEPEAIDNIVNVASVAGVEVYPFPGGVPPKYQLLNGTCGVILIWTK